MRRLLIAAALCAVGILAVALPAALAEEDLETRKAKIIANLKLAFPQLESAGVTISELEPSEFADLDRGTFAIGSGPRQQTQGFLVSKDDKKLFMVSGEPIDVSRSSAEIEAAVAERLEAEAKEAEERLAALNESVAGLPVRGNPDAAITIVEFSDFQCPYCARVVGTVEQLLSKYPEDVKFVFQHFPLNFHPWAKPAAIASICAANQSDDAFWQLHDRYFEHQQEINPENLIEKSKEYLSEADINLGTWSTCASDSSSEQYKAADAAVQAALGKGGELGVTGTPGFFVNGHFLSGAQPLQKFEELISRLKSSEGP